MKIKILQETLSKIIREQEEIDYGFFVTKKGNNFYLVLMDSTGNPVGYIRLYRNPEKGFSRDTFAAQTGFGQYMLMFNFAVASPNPVTVDRAKGTNRSAYKSIEKFISNNNITLVPIPKQSPDYVHVENPTEDQEKYLNTYMYSNADNSFLNEFIKNGKIIMQQNNLTPDEVLNRAENFFEKRYAGL